MLGETKRRRGAVALLSAVLVVVAASAVAHVWTHLKVIDFGYRISKAASLQKTLVERNRRLRIELALLKQPERVTRLAADRLGLSHLEPGQLRRLKLPHDPPPFDEAVAARRFRRAVAADVFGTGALAGWPKSR